jgi:hypothetical protein
MIEFMMYAAYAALVVFVVIVVLWLATITTAAVLVGKTGSWRDGTLFLAFQFLSGVLTIVGIPIVAGLAYLDVSSYDQRTKQWHWPRLFWLWDNDQDGLYPAWWAAANPTWSQAHAEFQWAALRNSCHNFGTLSVFRRTSPLWYRTFTFRGKLYYAKAGWMSSGYPAMSSGAGRGW